MIWKLEGGRVHLIPTSHFLSPRDYPIRRECSRAYSKSDVLVFECDWWAPVQPLSSRAGEAFGDAGDEFRNQVERALATLEIDKDSLASSRPEFVSMIMSTRVAELHGCFFPDGLDAHLRNRALANGKSVRFLESPTATNELLDAIPFDQRLADLRRVVENVDLMQEQWQVPRRVPERALVHHDGTGAPSDRSLAYRIQHRAPSQLAGPAHPGGVRPQDLEGRSRESIFNCAL